MTLAIVVLTTPSALPDIETAYTFGCGRLPPLYLLDTSWFTLVHTFCHFALLV